MKNGLVGWGVTRQDYMLCIVEENTEVTEHGTRRAATRVVGAGSLVLFFVILLGMVRREEMRDDVDNGGNDEEAPQRV